MALTVIAFESDKVVHSMDHFQTLVAVIGFSTRLLGLGFVIFYICTTAAPPIPFVFPNLLHNISAESDYITAVCVAA